MFKKTILIVGALVVATVTSSVSARANVHHHIHSRAPQFSSRGAIARRHMHLGAAQGFGPRLGARRSGSRVAMTARHHRRGRLALTDAAIRRYVGPRSAYARTSSESGLQTGGASYYGGGRTASGSHVGAATCAHRSLPFGTRVLVTNLANAHQAILTVNDRGPFVRGRIIDVSTGAAMTLGMLHSGTAQVSIQVVGGAS